MFFSWLFGGFVDMLSEIFSLTLSAGYVKRVTSHDALAASKEEQPPRGDPRKATRSRNIPVLASHRRRRDANDLHLLIVPSSVHRIRRATRNAGTDPALTWSCGRSSKGKRGVSVRWMAHLIYTPPCPSLVQPDSL